MKGSTLPQLLVFNKAQQGWQKQHMVGAQTRKVVKTAINTALVTTVLGLVVAIPLTLLHSFLQGKSKALIQVLEEQAAGLIARLAERHG